jgi:hypothetical protein
MSAQAPHPPGSEGAFGRYQVVEVLGAGAMGTVYLAHDEVLARDVAIKTVRPGLGGAFRDELHKRRFLNEARAVAALSHANIVRVFDIGFAEETPFLVMEVVRGRSLRERLERDGTLSANEARALGIQMARALLAAHEQGILHRDLKPANILEAEPGLWKLTDFGVARLPTSNLTIDGQFVGTPSYAAPESLEEGAFSPASDVYGLAATLYEAMTGDPPFGRQGLGTLSTTRQITPLSAKRPGLPADLDGLVLRALARAPGDRPSVMELAEQLAVASLPVAAAASLPVAAAAAPGSTEARGRRGWAAVALGVAVLVAIGAGLSSSEESMRRGPPAAAGAGFGPGAGARGADRGPTRRSRKQDKHWRKATDKLREGKLEEAEEKLEELLHENPDDREARALLERIRAQYKNWDAEEYDD